MTINNRIITRGRLHYYNHLDNRITTKLLTLIRDFNIIKNKMNLTFWKTLMEQVKYWTKNRLDNYNSKRKQIHLLEKLLIRSR